MEAATSFYQLCDIVISLLVLMCVTYLFIVLRQVEKNTNSKMDALLRLTATSSKAAGREEMRMEQIEVKEATHE